MLIKVLLVVLLVRQGLAIQCSHASATTNSICEGDTCYQVGSGASRGCLSGMKYLEEGCYLTSLIDFFICFCKAEFCNLYLLDRQIISSTTSTIQWANLTLPIIIYPKLLCDWANYTVVDESFQSNVMDGDSRGQFCAAKGVYNIETSHYEASVYPSISFADGLFGITPPGYSTSGYAPFYFGAYYMFQSDETEVHVQMLCNWEFCNTFDYFPILSQNLSCFVGDSMKNSTCRGQYCFIYQNGSENSIVTGCFTQDDSKAAGRIEVGEYQFNDRIYVICAENGCNSDWNKALASINRFKPNLPVFIPYSPSIVRTTLEVISSTAATPSMPNNSIKTTTTTTTTNGMSSVTASVEPATSTTAKPLVTSTKPTETTKGETTNHPTTKVSTEGGKTVQPTTIDGKPTKDPTTTDSNNDMNTTTILITTITSTEPPKVDLTSKETKTTIQTTELPQVDSTVSRTKKEAKPTTTTKKPKTTKPATTTQKTKSTKPPKEEETTTTEAPETTTAFDLLDELTPERTYVLAILVVIILALAFLAMIVNIVDHQ